MNVKVYSSVSCSPCRTLRYWLDKKGVAYKLYDIEDSAYRIAPTTLVNGLMIEGLQFSRLKEALAL